MENFKGLPMAVEAARAGGSMPTVLMLQMSWQCRKFLQKKIGFLDIYDIIAQSMEKTYSSLRIRAGGDTGVEDETYRWIESRW